MLGKNMKIKKKQDFFYLYNLFEKKKKKLWDC